MNNPQDIQVITNPAEVAALMDPSLAPPNTELAKTLSEIEADKKKKEEDRLKLEELRAQSKPKIQPIQLKYVYTGNCPTCNSQVKTLMVENEAGYFALCYCLSCDIQLESRKVEKLLSLPTKAIPELEGHPLDTTKKKK